MMQNHGGLPYNRYSLWDVFYLRLGEDIIALRADSELGQIQWMNGLTVVRVLVATAMGI